MAPLATAGGLRLHTHHWPATGAVRGTLLIVHGLGEHGGRYGAHVAPAFAAAGWQVHAYDQRGHGRSGGARGDVPTPDALQADLAAAIDALGDAPRPLALLGHSLGGLVAARFVSGALDAPAPPWSRPVDALLLSAPALDGGLSAFDRLRVAIGQRLLPHLALANGLPVEALCGNPAAIAAYQNDPLVHDRITAALAHTVLRDGPTVLARAPRWRVPTLISWSDADRCVAPRGCTAFVAAAPAGMVTAQPHPGLGHELFNERPQGPAIVAQWVAWLNAQQAA